ncbi:phage portal protein [Microbulbifer agarilyticus]|uniref:Phage portal protein n=1 Tax=Microbulbifer agarilyticus TaxID=260552 RepID=A0A1Q2M495_9GAMM|nr:phage portal protein [Microbulbifer agarilyticus]AQQ67480.1 phage portal protein [Microbulbifer agarilyticus]
MSIWRRFSFWDRSATSQQEGQQSAAPASRNIEAPKSVTEDTALQISAVWSCVRLLTETLASMPLHLYDVSGDERVEDSRHTLSRLLKRRPNARMSKVVWFETMQLNLVLHGNCYAVIDRNSRGDVISLWPLPAQQVDVETLADGSVVYHYYQGSDVSVFAEENILHVRLFGNGIVGLSPLEYGRNSIALATASEEFSTKFFKNGGKPGGTLTIDKILKPDQREQVRKNFAALTEGSENAHKLMVLEAGMKYDQVQLNPNDMQMLETRRFQLKDISRFFGVPSILINDQEGTTTWGTGVEQIMLGFYQLTMRPYLTRWEEALREQLFRGVERNRYSLEFAFEGLLRADSKGRAEYQSQMVNNGLMTRNEARKKENLPPLPGGDVLTAQTALAPLEQLGQQNPEPGSQ